MKRRISLALGASLLVGCGGSGGPAGESNGGSLPIGPSNQFGSIETRGQVSGSPIVRDLGKISTVALAGVLTDATYRPQGKPDNETAIAYSTASTLEMILPTGEVVESWVPSLANAEDYCLYPTWSPDGQRLYFATSTGIYYTTPANPTVSTLVLSAASIEFWSLSPDGTKICYTRIPVGETDREVYVRTVAPGTTKRLTTNDYVDTGTTWIDNERVAIFINDPVIPGTRVVRVSDLSSVAYTPYASPIGPVGRSVNGNYFLNTHPTDAAFGLSVTQRFGDSVYVAADYLSPQYTNLYGASHSPDGSRWAVASYGAGVFTTETLPQNVDVLVPKGPLHPVGISWQPALGVTRFVGASGKLGSASAGIVATRRTGPGRNGLASFVSWDAQTRTTSTVSDDVSEVGSGAKTYTIEADRLTALKYANRPFFTAVSTVSASGTANGAIVSVDGTSGVVQSIVVFQETRGAKPSVRRNGGGRVIEGSILSVWDAKGQNLAPQGASRVTLDEVGKPSVG